MELDELDDIYSEVILEHCRSPRNRAEPQDPDIIAHGVNPFCGDEVHIQVRLDDHGHVDQIGLQAVGCSINQAAGSMLTEALQGKTVDGMSAVSAAFEKMMVDGKRSEEAARQLGDLQMLSAVRMFPVRIKCALLAWNALQDGIKDFQRAHRS